MEGMKESEGRRKGGENHTNAIAKRNKNQNIQLLNKFTMLNT